MTAGPAIRITSSRPTPRLAAVPPLPGNDRRHRLVRLYLTATVLLSLMLSLYIWQSTKMIEIRRRIDRQVERISALETANAVLAADIRKLSSLDRIERFAREELGMIAPRNMCYFHLSGSSPGARR